MSATSKNTHDSADKRRPFKWSAIKDEAAQDLAIGLLTDEQIASKLKIGLRTLGDWKARGDFKARIESNLTEHRAQVRRRGISVIENRIAHLQHRHGLLNRVVKERGESPEMQSVAGGRTGLLVHNVKSVGAGVTAERIDLYEVDTGLLKELREHEKQVAQELGQWTEKTQHSGVIQFHPITLEGDKEISADDDPVSRS
jgi:hypothetical protein